MSKIVTRKEVLGEGLKLDADAVHAQIKFLQGKVLTIIEAVISDKVQLKATKDLINTAVSDRLMYVYQICYPDTQMLTSDQAEALGLSDHRN